MELALALASFDDETMKFYQQIGVRHVVVMGEALPGEEELDLEFLKHLQARLQRFDQEIMAIENLPEKHWHAVRIPSQDGLREKQLEHVCNSLRRMSELGITILGYNWMPDGVVGHWRHGLEGGGRGGAGLVSFDMNKARRLPIHQDAPISAQAKWRLLRRFLERVVPVAERVDVRLALHPDDPPAPSIGGIDRILTSVEALQKAVDLVHSDYSGLEFCQGTIAEFPGVGSKVVDVIRRFGEQSKIFYVHFRNVRGTFPCYDEVFIDEGDVDMFEAMKAYKECGFNGILRPDHTPVVARDQQSESMYIGKEMGRAFAAGYIRGLIQVVDRLDLTRIGD